MVMPSQDALENLAWVYGIGGGERPVEPLGSNELGSRGVVLALAPKDEKATNEPGSFAERVDAPPACLLVVDLVGDPLSTFDEPFDEHARFGIVQILGQAFIVEDAADKIVGRYHSPVPSFPVSPRQGTGYSQSDR